MPNDQDRVHAYDDPSPEDREAICADWVPPHPYWVDGADGQGGIAGRCWCGLQLYPVSGGKPL